MAIATDGGQVMREFDFMEIKGLPKASTAITKGEVLVRYTTDDGYRPSFANAHGPFFVALETAASSATPSEIKVLKRGVVKLTAESDVEEGQWVVPAGTNAGEVDPIASPFGTTSLASIIGVALEDIDAADAGKVLIGY
jgi:hypothetical protein